MKRLILASLLVVLTASTSFAAASGAIVWADAGKSVVGGNDAAATEAKPIGKLSTGVGLAWQTATTGYAIITQHRSGVKAFATSHDSTAIYTKTVVKEATTAAPATANSNDFATGWTTM